MPESKTFIYITARISLGYKLKYNLQSIELSRNYEIRSYGAEQREQGGSLDFEKSRSRDHRRFGFYDVFQRSQLFFLVGKER